MTHAPDLAWLPLSKEQRQGLARLARRAWATVGGDQPFDAWRHEQCRRACGRRISEASQPDFLPLRAHFLNLAGDPVAALQDLMRAETEPRRMAMHKLRRDCADRGLSLDYPAAICRRQYRCALEDASPTQLWQLVFTIRNRRPTRRAA
jgi:hypothetical protein